MLDPRYLRRNIREVAERLAIKGFELDQKFIEDKEIQRKKIQVETEKLQAERNLNSKKIGKLKSKGEEVGELLKQVASIGAQLDQSKIELEKIQNELNDYYMNIPNIPDISVPLGDSEDDNVEIRKWGEAQRADLIKRTMWISLVNQTVLASMTPQKFPAHASRLCAALWLGCTVRLCILCWIYTQRSTATKRFMCRTL